MSNKTYNFYCDESCHLENDSFPFMLISYISCAYNQVKLHSRNIRAIKLKHFSKGEIKWSNLSKSQYPFYSELVEYFFATDLQFRAIVIDKSKLKHEEFHQSHSDFYDKMYFQLLDYYLLTAYHLNQPGGKKQILNKLKKKLDKVL